MKVKTTGIYRMARILCTGLFLAACATMPDDRPTRTGLDRASPVRAAEVNTRLGLGYLEQGRTELALEKLQIAVDRDPDHVPAHLALGAVYESLGDNTRANRHLQRAARLAPEDGGTQNIYGVFLCGQRRYEEAERRFLVATEDPFYASPEVAWTNAGACARRTGDTDKAERFLRTALEIDPEFPDALYHMAEITYRKGDAFRARAFLQRFEAAAEVEPGSLILGYRVETALSSPAEAQRYASRLQQLFPDSPEARELRQADNDD